MSPAVVGFAGMTHLGLNSAVAAAEREFSVVGYDPLQTVIDTLNAGKLPVVEPGLPELYKKNKGRLKFTNDPRELRMCDIVYLSADVPTDEKGRSDLSDINVLIENVFSNLSDDATFVILCQVPPGFTRKLKCPRSRLYYQVETLIFGRAVERALNPERFIIGCDDPKKLLPRPYARFLEAFRCPIVPMRYESAELAKIAINCCLVASITVSNTLSELSERIGADWSEIVPALRLDKRIGSNAYLTPGLGLSGGNLERDLMTIIKISESMGTEASLIKSCINNSNYRRDWVLRTLYAEVLSVNSKCLLGILGLAYKENTHSTKNSPSLALIEHLKFCSLSVYDPAVSSSVVNHPNLKESKSALEVATGVNALLIMTPWEEFKTIKPEDLARKMSGKIIIDPFRVLNGEECVAAGLDYFCLGSSPIRAVA